MTTQTAAEAAAVLRDAAFLARQRHTHPAEVSPLIQRAVVAMWRLPNPDDVLQCASETVQQILTEALNASGRPDCDRLTAWMDAAKPEPNKGGFALLLQAAFRLDPKRSLLPQT